MWNGLGVNYKSAQTNWANDIAYFKRIGLTTIRPHLSNFPVGTYTPGSEIAITGSIDWWRNCAKTFLDAGFKVVHGVASSPTAPFTATVWTDYRAKVLQDAAYCQSLGLALDVYIIGNEIEGDIDNTTLTQSQLVTNLKALATDVKAVYPLAKKIGYSCYDAGSTMFNNFISAGLGDIDVLSANVYAQTGASGREWIFGDMAKLGLMIKTFGADRFTLSEFGITGNSSEYTATPAYNREYIMRQIYAGIRELGFTQAIAYSYVGYLDGDNQFALKNTDGTFDVQWGVLLADGGRSTITTVGGVTAEVSSFRTQRTTPLAQASERTVRPATRSITAYNSKGNLTANRVQPTDKSVLSMGLATDFYVSIDCKPEAKLIAGNNSRHTIARFDFNFGSILGYLIQINQSTGAIRFYSGSTNYDSDAGFVTYGTRQRITVTLKGTTLTAYVNNTLVTWDVGQPSKTVARVANDTGVNSWFLAENGGASASSNGFFGEVYEVLSGRTHLDSTEVAALITGTYPTRDIHYQFSRGAGRYTADVSGNNNHGLLDLENWVKRN